MYKVSLPHLTKVLSAIFALCATQRIVYSCHRSHKQWEFIKPNVFFAALHFGLFAPSLHLSMCQNELKCTDGCKLRCTDLVSSSLKHNLHFKWFGSSFSLQFHRCSNLIGARATVLCFIKSVL